MNLPAVEYSVSVYAAAPHRGGDWPAGLWVEVSHALGCGRRRARVRVLGDPSERTLPDLYAEMGEAVAYLRSQLDEERARALGLEPAGSSAREESP